MASPELSRTVNDALQAGDFAAALAPLQIQALFRTSDLPSVEKKSLRVLAKELQTPSSAEFWVKALLDPTPWIHIFAFKTLMRLGSEAQPIVDPLQQAILELWETQPIDMTHADQQTADNRREQDKMLVQAVELMFSADWESAVEFCMQQLKIHVPLQNAFILARQERYEKQQQLRIMAQQAFNSALGEILGIDIVNPNWELSRLSAEDRAAVVEQVQQRSNVRELWETVAEYEREDWGSRWHPAYTFSGAIYSLSKSKKEPQQRASARIRTLLRSHFDIGLQKNSDNSAEIAIFFLSSESMISHADFMREAPELLKSSREYALSLSKDHASRRLWMAMARHFFYAFYGYSRNIRYGWKPQDALELLDVLEPVSQGNQELETLFEQARGAYQHVINRAEEEAAKASQNTTPPRVEVAVPIAEIEGLFPVPILNDDESLVDYWERAHRQHLANEEKIQSAFSPEDFAKSNPWLEQERRIHQAILEVFNDDVKAEMIAELTSYGAEVLPSRYEVFSWLWNSMRAEDTHLLHPVTKHFWGAVGPALQELDQASKNRKPSYHPCQSLNKAHWYLTSLIKYLVASEGESAQIRVIKIAKKLRLRDLTLRLEEDLLSPFYGEPGYGENMQKFWENWKLDESKDELLEYLLQRVPKWPMNRRAHTYGVLGIGFYRRFTPESRRLCVELMAQTDRIRPHFFQALEVFSDEWTWLNILCNATVFDERFFDFWKNRRTRSETKESILVAVLNALPSASTDSAATMMVQMLSEVTPEELASHVDLIAPNIGSPHSKVAKWALETLLKTLSLELDWAAAIDNASGHLWGENAGVAKLTARLLGLVPGEQAPVAWEKLIEALELENLPLAEAVVRALTALKSKNRGLILDDAALERLETLAHLAPERFGKARSRLQVEL